MGNILGRDKPLKEVLRENKRMINRAIRELDREKTGLEREEKRLTIEIKKAAKENQMQSVKIMAKVRYRVIVVPLLLLVSMIFGNYCGVGSPAVPPYDLSVSFLTSHGVSLVISCFLVATINRCAATANSWVCLSVPAFRGVLIKLIVNNNNYNETTGLSPNETVHNEVHRNEITFAGMFAEITNGEIASSDGRSDAEYGQGDGENEQGREHSNLNENDGRIRKGECTNGNDARSDG